MNFQECSFKYKEEKSPFSEKMKKNRHLRKSSFSSNKGYAKIWANFDLWSII